MTPKQHREIDALIAETFFGLLVNRLSRQTMPPVSKGPGFVGAGDLKHYSTDLSEALTVIDKIRAMGHVVEDRFHQLFDKLEFKEVKRGEPIPVLKLDPLEICIAALKTLEVDISEFER